MNATILSAKFAAYIWFTECARGSNNSPREAHRFARENWRLFLACADQGWGRLLARLARTGKGHRARREMAAS
jgi:hypothetical protein